MVWANERGNLGSGLMDGKATFDARGGLTDLNDTSDKKIVEKGVPTDYGSNADIAWGRWTGGKSKVPGTDGSNGSGNGNLATLHYVVAMSSPTGPTAGLFTSFASTAPTVQSGGSLVATGAVNSAGGTVLAALVIQGVGTANYSLTVPVAGQTFSLTGVATQTSLSTFSGVSLITSTGTACLSGCTGSLGNNVSVIGQIAGPQGSQAGVAYGFDSRLGNVSGVIVFKR
jgi:hypothetical protein